MQTETYWKNIAKRMREATKYRLRGNIDKALAIESELDKTYGNLPDEDRIRFEAFEDTIRYAPQATYGK
jgi:hypothetical protein